MNISLSIFTHAFVHTYNPGQNYWDNRLKITPEIKFPSEQSKSLPPNNVDDNLHQPLFAFNFFQPTLDRGRGG